MLFRLVFGRFFNIWATTEQKRPYIAKTTFWTAFIV